MVLCWLDTTRKLITLHGVVFRYSIRYVGSLGVLTVTTSDVARTDVITLRVCAAQESA